MIIITMDLPFLLIWLTFLSLGHLVGHPPLSSASPVKLLGVGPRGLSEKKELLREQGVKNLVCQEDTGVGGKGGERGGH